MRRVGGTVWEGLALARQIARADPDASLRRVALPLTWAGDPDAAAALAALAPGCAPVTLPRAAEAWIVPLLSRGLAARVVTPAESPVLADALRTLLLARRAAPGPEVWGGGRRVEPRFVLNLPAFLDGPGAFDLDGFAEACALGVCALECLTGAAAPRLRLGFCDLAGLLAALGLPYGGASARAVGAALAALARGAAEAESGRLAARLGARGPAALLWPAPPAETAMPGLAEAARAALDRAAAAPGLRHAALLALAPADAAEALLGAETAGLQPAAGPTRAVLTEAGVVDWPTRAALRAAALGADRAAATLAPPAPAARTAMRDAVAAFLHAGPPPPAALPDPPREKAAADPSPTTRVLRVSVGGQRVTLHAAEDPAGNLVGITFAAAGPPALRSMLDAVARSATLGLRAGIPLASLIDALLDDGHGAGGAVVGDAAVPHAASILDWAARRLAIDYLGDAPPPPPSPRPIAPAVPFVAPLLPFDLPAMTAAWGRPARARRRSG